MKKEKSKFGTIFIVFLTVVLAGVAIFTAIRLYDLRDQAVAPNAPTSKPAAAEDTSCQLLTFTLTTPTGSGSPTPTGSPSSTPTDSPSPTPTGSGSPTSTPTGSPTSTPTGSGVATPTGSSQPELPDAGTSWPTIVGGGFGLLLIIGALMLAL